MRPRAAVPGGAAAVLLVLALAAGCGLPTDSGPQAIPRAHVPFRLLSPSPPPTPTTTAPTSVLALVQVYLVGANQQPVAVGRYVPVRATLLSTLDALMDGPTTVEATGGYTTAIPPGTRVLSAVQASTPSGTTVTVDFNESFGQVTGSAQVSAVEQVVFTVADQVGPDTGVVFEIRGNPIDVPTGNGVQVNGPVHALDFLPGPTTTTTTTAPAAP